MGILEAGVKVGGRRPGGGGENKPGGGPKDKILKQDCLRIGQNEHARGKTMERQPCCTPLKVRTKYPPKPFPLRPFRPPRPPHPSRGRRPGLGFNVGRKALFCREAALKAPAQTLKIGPSGPDLSFSGGGAAR